MACGIGICFSCVTKIRDPQGDWDYRRICVEGPIFDAGRGVLTGCELKSLSSAARAGSSAS